MNVTAGAPSPSPHVRRTNFTIFRQLGTAVTRRSYNAQYCTKAVPTLDTLVSRHVSDVRNREGASRFLQVLYSPFPTCSSIVSMCGVVVGVPPLTRVVIDLDKWWRQSIRWQCTLHIIPCCIIRGNTASPAPRQGDQFTRRERCDDILLDDDK